jgi:hypothetical protein
MVLWAAKDRPCADCQIRYPHYVMDFDHREGVEKLFNEYNSAAAFAIASLLALLALLTLAIKTVLEWKQARAYALAERE